MGSDDGEDADLGLLNAKIVDIFAKVALGTIGASIGVSGGFKLRGKPFPVDPLSLIFLVQAIAMTARIKQMPASYRENFAEKFEIFNLKGLALPDWTDDFMDWEDLRFFNENDAGENFKNHFFYVFLSFSGTLILQHMFIFLNSTFQIMKTCRGDETNALPRELKFPNLEVSQFMALNMGLLDLSSKVLTDQKSSLGWKVIAGVETFCTFLVIFFFYKKGRSFHERWEYRENKNITSFSPLGSMDANGDGLLSLDELDAQAFRVFNGDIMLDPSMFTQEELDVEKNRIVLTPEDAKEVFKKMIRENRSQFDDTNCMSVKLDEFVHELYLLKMNAIGDIGLEVLPEDLFMSTVCKIPYARTTFIEGMWALLPYVGHAGEKTGEYYPRKESDADNGAKNNKEEGSGNEDWDSYYNGFAPAAKYYYLQNMAMQVASAFVLNGLDFAPFWQAVAMAGIALFEFQSIVFQAPYAELSSTREELITKLGRVIVYGLVVLSFKRTLDFDIGFVSGLMVNTQAGMVSNSVSSQTAGIVSALLKEEPEPLASRGAPPVSKKIMLTRGALQELRRTPQPSQATLYVLEAVVQLLGHRASKKGKSKVRPWSEIQAIMNGRGFLNDILNYDPMKRIDKENSLSILDVLRIDRHILQEITEEEVLQSNIAVWNLLEWANAVVEIVKNSRDPESNPDDAPKLPRSTNLSFNEHNKTRRRSNSMRQASFGVGDVELASTNIEKDKAIRDVRDATPTSAVLAAAKDKALGSPI